MVPVIQDQAPVTPAPAMAEKPQTAPARVEEPVAVEESADAAAETKEDQPDMEPEAPKVSESTDGSVAKPTRETLTTEAPIVKRPESSSSSPQAARKAAPKPRMATVRNEPAREPKPTPRRPVEPKPAPAAPVKAEPAVKPIPKAAETSDYVQVAKGEGAAPTVRVGHLRPATLVAVTADRAWVLLSDERTIIVRRGEAVPGLEGTVSTIGPDYITVGNTTLSLHP